MSLADEPGVVDAVRSVAHPDAETLVVNSGGGDPGSRLASAGLDVRVVTFGHRLTAGAVRNIGVVETRAPVVSFLAADCVAGAGWIERRIAHHRRADAVASVIEPLGTPNFVARVYHLYRFGTRRAGSPQGARQLYGVSYDRGLFERHGLFREDVEVGEDTDFNERITPDTSILWAPDVVTYHRHPTTIVAAGTELFRRARRRKVFRLARGDSPRKIRRGPLYVARHARAALAATQDFTVVGRACAHVIFVVFFLCQTVGLILPTRGSR